MKNYLTIDKIGEAKIMEKKSVFMGHAAPVPNEEEAQKFIDSIKSQYPRANHHVYAFQIGENDEIQRANDGGEPAGTAGRPVLEAIRKEQLKNFY